jgi:hypothetical protein
MLLRTLIRFQSNLFAVACRQFDYACTSACIPVIQIQNETNEATVVKHYGVTFCHGWTKHSLEACHSIMSKQGVVLRT